MTLKLSERDLEKLLRQPERPSAPPADLLARLRADLPAELQVAPPADEGRVLRYSRWRGAPLLSLAATLAVLIGGSLIAYRTFRQSPWPEATGEASIAKDSVQDLPLRDSTAAPKEKSAAVPEEQDDHSSAAAGAAAPQPSSAENGGAAPRGEALPPAERETERALPAPPPPVDPMAAAEALPEGIVGGVAGGFSAPPDAESDANVDSLKSEPSFAAVAKKAEEESFERAQPVEAPLLLEFPAIEANSALEAPSPQAKERAAGGKPIIHRLEATSTQGDLRFIDSPRAPAAAPAPKADELLLGAAAAGDEVWRSVERALAEGRWPNDGEIAAARIPRAPATAVRPGTGSRQRTGAERTGDSWNRLREDVLDFLSREERSRSDLAELRRRTLRLLELEPGDDRGPALLRILNLASGKLAS